MVESRGEKVNFDVEPASGLSNGVSGVAGVGGRSGLCVYVCV